MSDKNLTIEKTSFLALLLSLFVFIFSLYIFPYYTNGDQKEYHNFYDNCLGNIFLYMDNYECYNNTLGSNEPVYFILASFFSIFFSKNVFISFFNALLTFILVKIVNLKERQYLLTVFLVFNFYFLVVFFSAERLKFSLIFLLLAFYFYLKCNILNKKVVLFSILACLSHFQVLILIGGAFLAYYRSRLTIRNILFIFIAVIACVNVFYDFILFKFNSYLNLNNFFDSVLSVLKVAIFIFMSFLYIKELRLKYSIILMSMPLLVAAFLLGSDRLVMFGFFIYLFAYIFKQRNVKFDVIFLFVIGYYFFKSWGFLYNIREYGNGF